MTGQTAPPGLAFEADILAVFRRDVARLGLAGEATAACVIYLALTSRLLPWGNPGERPVSVIPKGASATGKSHTTKTVLRFFPPDAYLNLGSMSKRFLFYCEEPFAHRFIVVPEWELFAKDDELVALIRTLLSEGQVVHGTVDAEGKRREARTIKKEGPTGLLITTTAALVDPELETRCLSFVTDDSPEQTRAIFETIARLENEEMPNGLLDEWLQLQAWLASDGPALVTIPYVTALAGLMPTSAARLRRDFETLLSLIRAHAALHRATRATDDRGRIVATLGDYEAVRDLVEHILGEGVEATVSPAIRETVEAVRELLDDARIDFTTGKAVADKLGVGKSAAYDRVRRALTAGYLVNAASKDERGQKLVLGTPLPDNREFLPSAEAVSQMRVGSESDTPSGLDFGSTMRPQGVESGSPACPGPQGETRCSTSSRESPDRVASNRLPGAVDEPASGPVPGERGFLTLIRDDYRAGRLTRERWLELVALHGELVRATPGPRLEDELPRLIAAGVLVEPDRPDDFDELWF